MSVFYAEKGEFKYLKKIPENSQKIHAPEDPGGQKMDRRGATPGPGGQVARLPPWPCHQGAWSSGTTPEAPLWLLFLLTTRKP